MKQYKIIGYQCEEVKAYRIKNPSMNSFEQYANVLNMLVSIGWEVHTYAEESILLQRDVSGEHKDQASGLRLLAESTKIK